MTRDEKDTVVGKKDKDWINSLPFYIQVPVILLLFVIGIYITMAIYYINALFWGFVFVYSIDILFSILGFIFG
jgi:hypothetical protein